MERVNWGSIIGHADCIARLKNLIEEGRMPHALLFVGPKGIGKFLTAQILAAALFCEQGEKPCGTCSSCRVFFANAHPDFSVVRPDGQAIKIDQIRALQSEISLVPCLSNRRVVIVDEAELMTVQSANCLLKTLEEPVGNATFILIAGSRRMLLDTIVSRCAAITFQALPVKLLTDALTKRGMAGPEAAVLAKLAEGSFGKAADLEEHGGLALRAQAMELLEGSQRWGMEEIWQCASALGELDRVKIQEIFLYLKMLFRDLLVLHSDESSILLYNSDFLGRLLDRKSAWSERKLIRAIEKITEIQKMLKANVNTRLACERFLLQLRDL